MVAIYMQKISWYDLGLKAMDDESGRFIAFTYESDEKNFIKEIDKLEEKSTKEATYFGTAEKACATALFGNLTYLYENSENVLNIPMYLRLCKGLDELWDKCFHNIENSKEGLNQHAKNVFTLKVATNLSFEIIRDFKACTVYDEQKEKFIPDVDKIKQHFKSLLNDIRDKKDKDIIKQLKNSLALWNKTSEYSIIKGFNNLMTWHLQKLEQKIPTDEIIKVKISPIFKYCKEQGLSDKYAKDIRDMVDYPKIMKDLYAPVAKDRTERQHKLDSYGDNVPGVIRVNSFKLFAEAQFMLFYTNILMRLKEENRQVDSKIVKNMVENYKELNLLNNEYLSNKNLTNISNEKAKEYMDKVNDIQGRIPVSINKDTGEFILTKDVMEEEYDKWAEYISDNKVVIENEDLFDVLRVCLDQKTKEDMGSERE